VSQALYNRYRPSSFATLVGQEHVTDALRAALSSGRVHHAYLFSGPRGCGKTSSARILAASLNCVHGPTPDPCGECEHCVAIRSGASMDVIEIDAASHGGVDDARELRERAVFTPASARFKVYIVDEAHQVTKDAFNALLKLVEEPPPHLKFVFATTEPDRVLQTIRSRTHHYAFRLVPPAVLLGHLAWVCEQEGVPAPESVLTLVVRAGAGSVRDSLSVLDQLLAGAGPEGLVYERAAALLGITDGVLLDDAVDALGARDGSALFGVVERVVGSGHDPRRFAADLLERLRDLVVLDAVPDAPSRGLLPLHAPDQIERMRSQAGRLGAAELSRAADVVHAGMLDMRGTTSARLLLELTLARALLPSAETDASAMLVRLDRLERRLAVSGTPAPPPPSGAVSAEAGAGVPVTDPDEGPVPGTPPTATAPTRERGGWADSPPEPSAGSRQEPAAPAAPAQAPQRHRPPQSAPAQPAAQSTAAQPTPAQPAAAKTNPAQSTPSVGIDVAGLRATWDAIVHAINRRPRGRSTSALLLNAQLTEVRGSELHLTLPTSGLATTFENGHYAEVLRDALTEVVGGSWRIRARAASAPAPEPSGGGGTSGASNARSGAGGRAEADTPSPEDEDLPEPGSGGTHDPVALLTQGLGARVIEERDAG
jgi:DNA polymerase-3 subunit gamma/tau